MNYRRSAQRIWSRSKSLLRVVQRVTRHLSPQAAGGALVLLAFSTVFLTQRQRVQQWMYPPQPLVPEFQKQLIGPWDYVTHYPVAGNLTTSLGANSRGGVVKVAREKTSLEFALPFTTGTPEKRNDTLIYRSNDQKMEVHYTNLPNGLKENIIITQESPEDFFVLPLSLNNLIAHDHPSGAIIFTDQAGTYQFHFEPPYAQDAAGSLTYGVQYELLPVEQIEHGSPAPETGTITQQLQQREQVEGDAENQYILKVSVNSEWLHDPARQYPIAIDPTVVHGTTAEFSTGQLNRVKDIGSGNFPQLETYYQELPADEFTIAVWHLNEGSTNTCSGGTNDACDSSGNALDGAFNNQAAFNANGHLGSYGVELDGTDDYIEVADSNALSQWQNGFTMEAWVKPDTVNGSNLNWVLAKGNTSNWEYALYLGTSGNVGCVTYTGAGAGILSVSSTAVVRLNQWNHLACAFDPTSYQMFIYLDGIEVARGTATTGSMSNGTSAFQIGRRPDNNGSEFDGVIDEVRLSSKMRTPEEIRLAASRRLYSVYTSDVIDITQADTYDNLYWDERGVATGDGETASSSANLVAQWNHNDTSGTTVTANTGTCGSTCNGTLNNYASTTQDAAGIGTTGRTAVGSRWGNGALRFDGINDYVNVANTANLQLTGNFTLAAWINPYNLSGSKAILTKEGSNSGYWLYLIGANVYTGFGNGSSFQSQTTTNTPIKAGEWSYVVSTWDGTSIRTYVNGALIQTSALSGNPASNTNDFYMGTNGGGGAFYRGILDVSQVYSRALPHHEILSNYNVGSIEFQTRSSADGSTWEAWKPTTSETAVESFDTALTDTDTFTESWVKTNTTTPGTSDTTGTNGQIPLGTSGTGDDNYTYHANVILDNGTYKMWYSGQDGATNRIYYATSSDGLTWTKVNNAIPSNSDTSSTDGRIPLGTSGTGDDAHTFDGAVIKDGSTYKMWYSGHDGTNWRIYYATSSDGLTWTKYNSAVPSNSDTSSTDGRIPLGTSGTGDDTDAYGPTVIKDGSTYRMWYVGSDGATTRIYYATSSDGLTWTKVNNAIPSNSDTYSTDGRIPLGTSNTGDDNLINYGQVVLHNGVYRLYYAGYSGSVWRVYAAISTDGSTWKKINNNEPTLSSTHGSLGRIPIGASGTADDGLTLPGTPVINSDTMYLWYNCYDGTNYRICRASMTSTTPLQSSADTVIKQEGTGSNKLTTGQAKVDEHTIAYWDLDETNGDNAGVDIFDASSNSFDGEINGSGLATAVVDGIRGKARTFNGTNDYIRVTDNAALKPSVITLSAWFKTSTTGTFIVGKYTGSPFPGYAMAVGIAASNKLDCWVGGTTWTSSTTTVTDGKWHHGVCSYDGSRTRVYVDGVLEATVAQTANLSGSTDLFIGSYITPANYFNGQIDEVKIDKTARTLEEIAEMYRQGQGHSLTKTLSSTDLSGKTHLPFYVAADRPGTYLQANLSESTYASYQPDSSTVAQWHLNDPTPTWGDTFSGSTINTAKWVELDTPAKISQNNGLVFSAGATGNWDASLISQKTFPRTGNLQLNTRLITPGSLGHLMIGFANNQSSNPSFNQINHALYFAAGTFQIYQDNSLVATGLGSGFAINTTYDIRITLYTTGPALYEIKGGAYTDWTILYLSDGTKSNSPVRVQFAQHQSTYTISSLSVTNLETPLLDSATASLSNANLVAHTFLSDGAIGQARYFDGASVIRIPEVPSTDLGALTDNFTLETWFKTTTNYSAEAALVAKNDGSGGYSMLYMGVNESVCLRLVAGVTTDACSVSALNDGNWHHVVGVRDATNDRLLLYLDGTVHTSTTDDSTDSTSQNDDDWSIGNGGNNYTGNPFTGWIDEVRISNTARTATEIRQAFEFNKRSQPITIDFTADLDSGNLITGSGDLSFTVDATAYGLEDKGSMVFKEDTVIVRETVDDTDYLAQGEVTAITTSTGAVTIDAWDAGSTFPTGGFTTNAVVFKWQREFIDLTGWTDDQINAVTSLNLQVTNGVEGRTIWLDDLKSTGGYLSNPLTNTLTSTAQRYFQYRAVISSSDATVSPWLEDVTFEYTPNSPPGTPTLDSPADTATNQILTPTLRTTATDVDGNYLRYKIELCTNVGMTTGCQTFDQTSSQTGWSGQNTQSSTAYTSGTQGVYTVQTELAEGTTYYWRSSAIDPGGTNTWGATQGTPYSFTTSNKPSAPTLVDPTNGEVDQPIQMTFQMSATDANSDYLRYKIEVCKNSSFTDSCQTFNQTVSQTGWSGQNTQSGTAYTSGTTATYAMTGALDPETNYYWRAYAIDPGGSNTWSNPSTSNQFVTEDEPDSSAQCSIEKARDNSSLTVQWNDESETEDGFLVQKSTNGGAFGTVNDAAPGATSYLDTSIANGNTYKYRIAPYLNPGPIVAGWCETATLTLQAGDFDVEGLNLEGVSLD